MRHLEKILKIIDDKERLSALREYARSLNIDTGAARSEEGELVENRLIMLIYDGEEAQKFARNKNVGIWAAGLFLSLVFLAVVWFLNTLVK